MYLKKVRKWRVWVRQGPGTILITYKKTRSWQKNAVDCTVLGTRRIGRWSGRLGGTLQGFYGVDALHTLYPLLDKERLGGDGSGQTAIEILKFLFHSDIPEYIILEHFYTSGVMGGRDLGRLWVGGCWFSSGRPLEGEGVFKKKKKKKGFQEKDYRQPATGNRQPFIN